MDTATASQQAPEASTSTKPAESTAATPSNRNLILLLEDVERLLVRQQSLSNRYLIRRVRREISAQRTLAEPTEEAQK